MGAIHPSHGPTPSTRARFTGRVHISTTSRHAEERSLIPGVAFSIEPGIYIPNTLGVRSEVNGLMREREVVITPTDFQTELLVVGG